MMRDDTAMVGAFAILLAFLPGLSATVERPTKEFAHAVAFKGETQEDAPALEIYLTRKPHGEVLTPAPPYLHIELEWHEWGRIIGKDLALVPLSRRGLNPAKLIVRAEVALEREKQVWLTGTLRLKTVDVGKRVIGSYAFADPTGERWTGKFEAPWVTPKKRN